MAIFPEILTLATEKDFERLALKVRKYFGGDLPFKPTLDMSALLENAGISVEYKTMSDDAILCVKDENGYIQTVAFFNESIKNLSELNFLRAHVLGHVILHVQPKLMVGEWKTSGLKEIISPLRRYNQNSAQQLSGLELLEWEADQFAAALLLPKAMLVKAFDKIQNIDALVEFFDVDKAFLTTRLQQAHLIAVQPGNFIAAEQAIGASAGTKANKPTKSESEGELHSDAVRLDKSLYPKSFAASNYSNLERRTKVKDREPKPELKSAIESADVKVQKSLSRIRQLARKIDKDV